MTEYTRQLRPRGSKVKASNISRGNQSDVTKRKVLGEISNQRTEQPSSKNSNVIRKPAAKRKVSVLSQIHRRSTRSTTTVNDNAQSHNVAREAKRRKCDENTVVAINSNKQSTRSSTRSTKVPPRCVTNETISTTRTRVKNRDIASNNTVNCKDGEYDETKIQQPVNDSENTKTGTLVEKTLKQDSRKEQPKKERAGNQTNEILEAKHRRGRVRTQTVSRLPKRRAKSEPRPLCSDFLVDSNFTLVRHSFDASKYTAGISEYDKNYVKDTLQVSNYVTDIYQRLYHNEPQFQPDGFYMGQQDEINAMMRAILIDWLVEVHMKFKLVPDTLYLSVNIIDRYCSIVEVPRRKLQLVGVTALLLACKYEEIYPPEVRDCVYITDKAYTRQDVIDMEQDIVRTLEFKLTAPTGYKFLVRYLFVLNVSDITKAAANYYMERTLQEYHFISIRPSLIAAAAVCLALNNHQICNAERGLGNKPGIPDSLVQYTGYEKKEILRVCDQIASNIGQQVVTASERQLIAVKRKFDSRKYYYVSTDLIDPEINDLRS